MSHTILLYGATGYSGRMIVDEILSRAAVPPADGGPFRLILAGRRGRRLAEMAEPLGLEYRVFGLESRDEVTPFLADVDVVVNAAGPFEFTAIRLAKAALASDSRYVDINGESSVYMQLDDLGRHAADRGLPLLCSAGHSSAASDMLVNAALGELLHGAPPPKPSDPAIELGAIRIAMSRVLSLSRGSVETLLRSVREQVTVVRRRPPTNPDPSAISQQILWHEPVGKLERTVYFADPRDIDGNAASRKPRIVTGANLVDTLSARLTVERHGFVADRIESYVEADAATRAAYQVGAYFAPVAALPVTRRLARLQLAALPAGPTPEELRTERHTIVLEIEDPYQSRIVDWHWHTPNPYVFTAQVVVEIAMRICRTDLIGWLTPSDLLDMRRPELTAHDGFLRGCRLVAQTSAVE